MRSNAGGEGREGGAGERERGGSSKTSEHVQSSVSSSVATTAVNAPPSVTVATVVDRGTGDGRGETGEGGERGVAPAAASVTHKRGLPDHVDEFRAEGLISHPMDVQVKPIVGNKGIEIIDVPPFKASSLPCKALTVSEVSLLSQKELEAHLTLLYTTLHKASSSSSSSSSSASTHATAQAERLNLLSYLCTLSPSAEVANVVMNTHFLPLILRLIRPAGGGEKMREGSRTSRVSSTSSNSSECFFPPSSLPYSLFPIPYTLSRTQVVLLITNTLNYKAVLASPVMQTRLLAITVLAMMIRFATFILPPPSSRGEGERDEKADHIIPALSAVLKETPRLDVKIRRRALAALGEVVFYISAQGEEGEERGGRGEDPWKLPTGALSLIVRCLREVRLARPPT